MQSLALLCHSVIFLTLLFQLAPAVSDKKKPREELKVMSNIKLKGQCQIIALNLLGVPSAQNWHGAESCEEACKNKLFILNESMAARRNSSATVFRGGPKKSTHGQNFKIDPCLAGNRLCSKDFAYPTTQWIDAAIASQAGFSLEYSSGCLCQRALVLQKVWEEEASVANWKILNPDIPEEYRPRCTIVEICRRLQETIGPLDWQCIAARSHVIQSGVNCVDRDAHHCPCWSTIYTRGQPPFCAQTCLDWPLKFPTFGGNLVQETSHEICVDFNGVIHFANVANGRLIPQQPLKILKQTGRTPPQPLAPAEVDVNTIFQPSDQIGDFFDPGARALHNYMHSDFAAAGEGTSGTPAPAATDAPHWEDLPVSSRIFYGLENSIAAFGEAADFEQASSSTLWGPIEQNLVSSNVNRLFLAEDLNEFSWEFAEFSSFENRPMPAAAANYNLDSMPSLPLHGSLDQAHETGEVGRRAGKRPRSQEGPNGASSSAGSSSRLGRLLDAASISDASRVNLDSWSQAQTQLRFPNIGSSNQQGQHLRQQQQQQHWYQRSNADSLYQLSRIANDLEADTDIIPEDETEQDEYPIL